MMQDKVTNDLFAAFVKAEPQGSSRALLAVGRTHRPLVEWDGPELAICPDASG